LWVCVGWWGWVGGGVSPRWVVVSGTIWDDMGGWVCWVHERAGVIRA
jgi:hypothetical protein